MLYLSIMTDKQQKLLIGYWPLLDPTDFVVKPGDISINSDSLSKKLAEIEIPQIAGVMWGMFPFDAKEGDDTVAIPIFIMEKAYEVASHLMVWMEGDTSWFSLHFEQRDIGYSILLLPDVAKSVERWKAARLMYYEEIVADDNFLVYYQTIGTCCLGGGTFARIKSKIDSPCHVGFIDINDVGENPLELDEKKIIVTGPFEIKADHKPARYHLDQLFDTTSGLVKSKLNP